MPDRDQLEASFREAIVQAAAGQLGARDHRVYDYWRDVLGLPDGSPGPFPPQWCGAFALWCLHQAGVAVGTRWMIGRGFLLVAPTVLPAVAVPRPGDISYKGSPFQHHAVVGSVDQGAGVVHTIDGNQGPPLFIKRSQHALGNKAFTHFSVSPHVAAAVAKAMAA